MNRDEHRWEDGAGKKGRKEGSTRRRGERQGRREEGWRGWKERARKGRRRLVWGMEGADAVTGTRWPRFARHDVLAAGRGGNEASLPRPPRECGGPCLRRAASSVTPGWIPACARMTAGIGSDENTLAGTNACGPATLRSPSFPLAFWGNTDWTVPRGKDQEARLEPGDPRGRVVWGMEEAEVVARTRWLVCLVQGLWRAAKSRSRSFLFGSFSFVEGCGKVDNFSLGGRVFTVFSRAAAWEDRTGGGGAEIAGQLAKPEAKICPASCPRGFREDRTLSREQTRIPQEWSGSRAQPEGLYHAR